MKPFIALIYNDSKDYSRNRAAGMSYLNRFLIEEDTQFDCAEIVEWKLGSSWENSVQDLEKKFIKLSKKSNSDFIRHLILSMDFFPVEPSWNILTDRPFESFIRRLKIFPDISYMITGIVSHRLECVQKEHYEKLYSEGGPIKYNEVDTFEVHQSIGNEIDDCYDRIKMNKINFGEHKRLLTNSEFSMEKSIYRRSKFFESPYSVKTFHLSMLSDQEERKINKNLHSEDTGNRKLDYFKKKTKLSKKEQNYALSMCWRKTIHMGPLENGKRHYREIIRPEDLWEERIMNYCEELQRLIENSHWEDLRSSDSNDSSDFN